MKKLAHHWTTDYPRSWRRKSFVKEWQLLRVILNYYKEEVREGADYNIPSFKKVRKATEFVPSVEGEVQFLDADETVLFLNEVRRAGVVPIAVRF